MRSVWYPLLPLAVLLVLAACGPSQREQDLEAEVSALQGQVSGLQSDLAASEAVSGDLESELEQSRVQIGEFEARLAELQAVDAARLGELEEAREELADLERRLAESLDENQSLAAIAGEYEQLSAEYESLSEQLSAAEQELEQQLQVSEEERQELLSRLALMRAPNVFLLEDLVGELDVPRDRLLAMLEMLSGAPFHLVAKVDHGEFVLRQRVADSLENLASYASSLRERLPTKSVEKLTGLAEPDLLTEDELEGQTANEPGPNST